MQNKYSNNRWLEERLNGNESYLWYQARKIMLLSKPIASALDLVNGNSEKIYFNLSQDELMNSQQKSLRWTENADNSVRMMIDLIVTRWKPQYTYEKQVSFKQLHQSLISTPLESIASQFGKSIGNIKAKLDFVVNSYLDESHDLSDPFDDEKSFETYRNRFVPLHYHELWANVVNKLKEFENTNEEHVASIDVQQVQYTTTSNKTEKAAILIGTYSSTLGEWIF
jgi:hypothetical protein